MCRYNLTIYHVDRKNYILNYGLEFDVTRLPLIWKRKRCRFKIKSSFGIFWQFQYFWQSSKSWKPKKLQK